MREVNFSIPNVNKASVNITTTLYDRRALDCTSALPLINSLNHLAYLTTSSARIRDILTVDGGIERLVCILKEGRSKDLMEMWKWSLAFQCVVNIGVRGSENVRTRVVEADMVPVIATILDNYIQVVDKIRARADADNQQRSSSKPSKQSLNRTRDHHPNPPSIFDRSLNHPEQRVSRRQAPPPSIQIPQPFSQDDHLAHSSGIDITPPPNVAMTSPPERTTFGREVYQPRLHDGRFQQGPHGIRAMQPLATAVPSMDAADGFGLRPLGDVDRLNGGLPRLQSGLASQPESPTTPSGPVQPRSVPPSAPRRQRPVFRQHRSGSGESDDANGDEDSAMVDDNNAPQSVAEPIVGVQNAMEIDNVGDGDSMLDEVSDSHGLAMADPSRAQDAETFNITHRSVVDGSIVNTAAVQANGPLGFNPIPANVNSPTLTANPYASYLQDRSATAQGVLTAMPRDEDVLMSLQLLAYVSKYCNLRSYFQNSHLVPKLQIGRELALLDDPTCSISSEDPLEEENEYLLPDDFNIFPLVEKFTVRHHSKDMQYWACVVMRNLCRKDESRGGIRQCAYYQCGKWEEFQRQFAKCRRCRRTKYCSKDCQKAAWVYHRHWCHSTPS
ncbi:hypothetical protein V8E54_003666 [Elaphomyces granulatus]